MIRFDVATRDAIFDQLVNLGDRNNKTLGFLPYAGFRVAALEGRIAVALNADESVLGYCLFDLPRNVVRIVQLCVSSSARGGNLARELVEAVSARHADRLGLVLKCRADWPADKMWPKLGFTAQTQVPGRSKQQHPLTVWWRSNGHTDLFTLLAAQRVGRNAAVDSNVYSDLHSAKLRHGAKHTAVLADFIADDQLRLFLLPSLEEEIYATGDPVERTRFLNAKLHYARAAQAATAETVEWLLSDIPPRAMAKDESLRRDAKYVAEAHANDIDLFITRDEGALKFLSQKAALLGVEVLHPTAVPTYLDVERASTAYQSAQLQNTDFTVGRLDRELTTEEVNRLLDRPGGERLTEFRALLSELAGRSTSDVDRQVLFDGAGHLWAVWATRRSGALEVPLLRIASGPLQQTLAAQLSKVLRDAANSNKKTVIRATDPHLQRGVVAALIADGYYAEGGNLIALTLPIIGTWDDAAAAAREATGSNGEGALTRLFEPSFNPSVTQTAEIERILFPVKILGQGLPNYLVPIKRPFATQLLGYPASLMSRPSALGLSREHVYYGSRRGPLTPPGRILWYVSGKTDPSVVASSNLVEVREDTPERLHRLHSRLGVWSRSDVERAARRGRAVALRFTGTEVFPRPVGLDRMRAMAGVGQRLLLRSAITLDEHLYERIYREGVRR